MRYEKVVDFKDSLTGSIPIVEELKCREHKDISKTKAQCKLCKCTSGAHYVSTVSGMVLMCKQCEKKMTVNLYIADKQLKTSSQIVDMVIWLNAHPLRAFKISTESTALKNPFTKAIMVDIKDKFNMVLTPNRGKVTPLP